MRRYKAKYVTVYKKDEHSNIRCFKKWEDIKEAIRNDGYLSSHEIYEDAIVTPNPNYRELHIEGKKLKLIDPYRHSKAMKTKRGYSLENMNQSFFDLVPEEKIEYTTHEVVVQKPVFKNENIGSFLFPKFKKVEVSPEVKKEKKYIVDKHYMVASENIRQLSITRRYNLYVNV